MKRLSLLCHAKSSWKQPELADIERPLNARGKRDAPVMGERLAAAGFRPDLLVTSPARRAARTASRIARAIGYPEDAIRIDREVYFADAAELLRRVRALPPELGHVAIVGHNPSLTEIANTLAGAAIANVPTCGVVRLELDVDAWSEARPRCARVIDFDYPKREA